MRFVVGALGMLSSVLVMPPTAAAAVERPDDGSFAVVGHGFGHGRGMSQWGAYGAARAGVGHRDILRFYYPGTVLGKNSGGDLRVLLTHDGTDVHVRAEPGLAVWWTAQNRRPTHRRLPQRLGGCAVVQWRVRPYGPDDMTVQGSACGHWHDYLGHDDIFGGGRVSFVPSDDTFAVRLSRARREYRGGLRILRDRMGLRPVNIVPYEEYLRSVVPAEVPASWPTAALRAQAVAARSYALASARDRTDAAFDVYDTTRSQAYPGLRTLAYGWRPIQRHETARTDAAIRATRGDVLTYRGRPARTEFASSNGGRTLAGPVPYGR
ncbi:MAG TPA: SpoIID/LytB domain-containing protein, partial [Actinopolymorphaceae bacterium]